MTLEKKRKRKQPTQEPQLLLTLLLRHYNLNHLCCHSCARLRRVRILPEVCSVRCGLDVARPNRPVTKPFTLMSLESPSFDHGFEDGKDFGFGGGFEEGLVQSCTEVATTKHHLKTGLTLFWTTDYARHSPYSYQEPYRRTQPQQPMVEHICIKVNITNDNGDSQVTYPLGQPVILITRSSLLTPASSQIFSTLSINTGKYLSDSAMAKPQVGKATQAELDSRTPEWSRLSRPHLASNLFISSRSSGATSERIKCWLAVNRKVPL